jgi:hypothetical protein
MSKSKKNSIKKFSLPLGKVLMFNLKGKAIEESADERDVRAYLIEKGFANVRSDGSVSFDRLHISLEPSLRFTDWLEANRFQSKEERDKAFHALAASPNPPRWMVRFLKGSQPPQGGAA